MKDRPGVVAPPPVIFLVAFVIGYFGRRFVPYYQSFAVAAVFCALGAFVLGWGVITMVRAGTHIDPYEPATRLVTGGPFRFTRNPLYAGVNLLYIALAVSLGLTSTLVLLPVADLVLHYGVIRREERYLEAKFGDAYRAYKTRVRRWL